MNVQIVSFDNLSLTNFHDLVALRIAVFVIEQNCPYQDLDGKDKQAFHALIRDEQTNKLIGTARILPAGLSYPEVSIGRVASHPDYRDKKIGHLLMTSTMDFVKKNLNDSDIRISAQSHLCRFYSQYGFVSTGKEYLEDDIPHTEMLYRSSTSTKH